MRLPSLYVCHYVQYEDQKQKVAGKPKLVWTFPVAGVTGVPFSALKVKGQADGRTVCRHGAYTFFLVKLSRFMVILTYGCVRIL